MHMTLLVTSLVCRLVSQLVSWSVSSTFAFSAFARGFNITAPAQQRKLGAGKSPQGFKPLAVSSPSFSFLRSLSSSRDPRCETCGILATYTASTSNIVVILVAISPATLEAVNRFHVTAVETVNHIKSVGIIGQSSITSSS